MAHGADGERGAMALPRAWRIAINQHRRAILFRAARIVASVGGGRIKRMCCHHQAAFARVVA